MLGLNATVTYHQHFADRADVVDIDVDEYLERSPFRNIQSNVITKQEIP